MTSVMCVSAAVVQMESALKLRFHFIMFAFIYSSELRFDFTLNILKNKENLCLKFFLESHNLGTTAW